MIVRAGHLAYTYQYAHTYALKGVSFRLNPGEIMCIAGHSGSGKSTLLKLLCGALIPQSGTITYDHQVEVPEAIGFVMQNPRNQLFAETVEDDVAFGLRNKGLSSQESLICAHEALEKVGLNPKSIAQMSPFALSGGQAQRVALAGVMAMKPELYLFDEPLTGLDSSGKAFALTLMCALAAEGASLAVVTHNLADFLPITDKLILLKEGYMVWQGSSAHAIDNPNVFRLAGLEPPELLVFQEKVSCQGAHPFRYSMNPHEAAQRTYAASAQSLYARGAQLTPQESHAESQPEDSDGAGDQSC